MNILEIAVIVLALGFGVTGWCRGFVRKLASMLSLVISIVLVSMFLPYVTDFLKNNTPVYQYIVKQCRQIMEDQISGALTSGTGADTALDQYRSMGREQIKRLMEENGYDSSVVDTLSDEQLEQYKEQYIQEYAARYLSGTQTQGQQPDRVSQTELIESLPLPEALKDMLLENNNDEGYANLQVSTFQDYVVHFIATLILNVISFVAAVVAVQILLSLVIAALDFLARAPVISGINRLAGFLLGLLQALFFLWLFFLILSMTATTEIGLQLMSMVQESRFLGYLYDSNLFMQIVLQAAAIFI